MDLCAVALCFISCELGAPLFTEYVQAPDDTNNVSSGAFLCYGGNGVKTQPFTIHR